MARYFQMNKKWGGLILAVVLLLCFSVSWAQEEGLDGLLLDQTQTRAGHEFYRDFVTFWEAPEGIEGFNIFIGERASAQWGSWIWIKVNDMTVYRKMLKPQTQQIQEAAKEGVEVVKRYLFYRYSEDKKRLEQLEHGDMSGEDI